MEKIGHRLANPIRVYAFEELLLLPGFAQTSPKDIDLGFGLAGLRLGMPFISSPMDTVTESEMATALALNGCLGVLHRNCSVNEAVQMAEKVKAFEPGSGSGASALKDADGRLAVGAAISPLDMERATALADKVDLLFSDVASFHNKKVMDGSKRVMKETGKKLVIGNMGTKEGVLHVVSELGAENIAAVKVGLGGGSICITTDVTGVGSPCTFAVEQAADALNELGLLDRIPIIADGGIRHAKDIAICMGLGASLAMLGNLFARCEESPGERVERDGKPHKVYWGMGSEEARAKRLALDRYQDYGEGKNIAEGIKTYVPIEGRVSDVADRLASELRVSMGYVGAKDIREMRDKARIVLRSAKEPEIAQK